MENLPANDSNNISQAQPQAPSNAVNQFRNKLNLKFKLPIPHSKFALIFVLIFAILILMIILFVILYLNPNRIAGNINGVPVKVKEARESLEKINKVNALSKVETSSNFAPAVTNAANKKKLLEEVEKRNILLSEEEICFS